jgi:2-polyprenyl-3-methyl-5-hydroxy-6-metoxy-1,4-benzoquinol methylase
LIAAGTRAEFYTAAGQPNAAIVSTLAALSKGDLLDVGCGEGWLSREAAQQGWRVVGLDASAALIEQAREASDATYLVMEYKDIPHHVSLLREFDCIVCNFAILGEDVQDLLTSLRGLLKPGGSLVIQSVHPWAACGEEPYRNGWREETFQGWSGRFTAAMPWFFRSLESWFGELSAAGLRVTTLVEPVDPTTGRPLSLLLLCKPLRP